MNNYLLTQSKIMNTEVWGSCGWLFLHSVALNYPVNPTYNDKVYMKTFFEMVGKVLPCNSCKKHLNVILSDI